MANVVLKNLSKRFGDVVAVDDVNLEIADREFVVLVGPSGCGKTVLLRIVAGLTHPSSGHVYFDERVMDEVPASERNIAMTFQMYALYPNLTVEKNWEFPLYAEGCSQDEIKRRIRSVGAFPDRESALRLVTAVVMEISEEWQTGRIYLRLDQD